MTDDDARIEAKIRSHIASVRRGGAPQSMLNVIADTRTFRPANSYNRWRILGQVGLILAVVAVGAITLDLGRRWSGSSSSGSPLGDMEIPTVGPSSSGEAIVCNQALQVGRLRGMASDVQILWLEAPSGQRIDVIWPSGLSARFLPEAALVREGAVIARAGDSLRLTGGFGASPTVFSACAIEVNN